MNHREPTSARQRAGVALPWLALLLLHSLASNYAWSRPVLPPLHVTCAPAPTPYLAALGSPALRFQEAAPLPEIIKRPVIAPKEPLVAEKPSPNSVSVQNPPAAVSSSEATRASVDNPPAQETETEAAAPKRTPPAILPDENHPQARPEDFLPFFQIPAGKPGEATVIVPVPRAPAAPASLPLSSATYTQTPR